MTIITSQSEVNAAGRSPLTRLIVSMLSVVVVTLGVSAVSPANAAAPAPALSAVVEPAADDVAEPLDEPTDPRAPGDPTPVDPARVDTGLGVESTAIASQFEAGYLISDYAFFNRSAMSESEIQAFLEARIDGPCLNSNCLASFRVTTTNKVVTPRCNGYTGAPNESAARIIYKVQVSCGVSAKVILATLQKETSLVTLRAPLDWRIERAMGYYCPDDPNNPGW
ncbi:MAG: hypothetical protein Q7J04_01495, partial [Microcella sp.]|nr:hypothetical protein [Microcella sp.]